MKRLAAEADSPNGIQLIGLNSRADPHMGMLSYPNYDGPGREVQNPNMHLLAAVAEAAGLDFRVLVLQRPAEESWRSFHSRFFTPASMMGMVNSASNLCVLPVLFLFTLLSFSPLSSLLT
jgi:hypothetical protein